MLILARQLRATAVASPAPDRARITILGLLEARLLRSDVTVLGGLNEGKWPAQSDPGPWVSRPMRDVLGMQMPERDIGMTAHDFAQAFAAERVYHHLVGADRRRPGGAVALGGDGAHADRCGACDQARARAPFMRLGGRPSTRRRA